MATEAMMIHFTHPQHCLHYVYKRDGYRCRGCREVGYGFRYRCHECNFDLHRACACAPMSLPSSGPHPDHALTFNPSPPSAAQSKPKCAMCGGQVSGFSYGCSVPRNCVGNAIFHPNCAMMPPKLVHPLHPHSELHLVTLDVGGPRCFVCAVSAPPYSNTHSCSHSYETEERDDSGNADYNEQVEEVRSALDNTYLSMLRTNAYDLQMLRSAASINTLGRIG